MNESWEELREALQLLRLSDDELRRFVDDYVSDRIFTSAHLRDEEAARMLPMIFLPVALGCFSKTRPDSLKQIGVVWEYLHKAGPRGINGRPVFFSMNLLHIDDWERARTCPGSLGRPPLSCRRAVVMMKSAEHGDRRDRAGEPGSGSVHRGPESAGRSPGEAEPR